VGLVPLTLLPAEERNVKFNACYPSALAEGFLYSIRCVDENLSALSNLIGGKKMAKVEIKQPIVEEISAAVKDAKSVVLVDYRGLTVAEDTQLRKQLREAGVNYKVYKNTMMNFAFKGTDFEALAPFLEGPSAAAICNEDPTAAARVIAKFAKTAKALEIKAGVVEGEFYDASGIQAIAEIPGKDELLARLLGSMKSPISNIARVLNQIAEKGGASAAPAEEAKAEEAPVEEAKAEEAPAAEEAKAEEAPAEEAKAEEAPAAEEANAAE